MLVACSELRERLSQKVHFADFLQLPLSHLVLVWVHVLQLPASSELRAVPRRHEAALRLMHADSAHVDRRRGLNSRVIECSCVSLAVG